MSNDVSKEQLKEKVERLENELRNRELNESTLPEMVEAVAQVFDLDDNDYSYTGLKKSGLRKLYDYMVFERGHDDILKDMDSTNGEDY